MDLALFHLINNLSEKFPALSPLMIFSAKYLPLFFPLALIALWLSFQRRQQIGAFLAGISTLISLGIAQIVAFLYPRPRPYLNHVVHLLIDRSQDPSFPSDHAVFTFAIAAMIWKYNRKAGTLLLGLATLVSFSRVYVGTHYPSDVIGGAILGIFMSWAIDIISKQRIIERWIIQLFSFLRKFHLAAKD